ncbi:MAG: HlyD family efflux transporter periplasmic adaptor subunit [Gammaproteobacteria bacterium]|nr:HlyD family efflux transporter periplasmic adaptor subunit [Gammaproteobacteria bacterium]
MKLRSRVGLGALLLALAAAVPAHEGHGHAEPASAAPVAPSAALPVAAAATPRISRPARVIADVRRSVLVAAPEAGVLEAPAGGFKRAGQTVRAGELLGRLRPATPQALRRDLEAQLVEARRDTALGALQIDRYGITEAQRFDISLPTQTLQILTDYTAAKERRAQFENGLDGTVEIRAPRSGRVLRSDADASRQLAAGESLFAIQSDGEALAVELKVADDRFVAPQTAVAVLGDGRELPLARIGSGFDQAQRVHLSLYAPQQVPPDWVVNQRLRVQWPAAPEPGR